jgi:hypothetical protein
MCQKIGREELKRVVLENYIDTESERYAHCKKEEYINIIHKMSSWEPKTRKLRFLLPEICVYENSQPTELISKKQENQHIKIAREKAKLHMLEITQFFLEGFVFHNP